MISKKHVARNMLWNGLGMVCYAVVGFLISPYLLYQLGDEAYGLWIVIGSLTSYFGLLDLGIRGSVGRYVAFHRAAHDRQGINSSISTALACTLVPATIVILFALPVQYFFFRFFSVPPGEVVQVRLALWLIIVNLALSFPLSLFDGLLWAGQRFDLINAIEIVFTILRAGTSYYVVRVGYGLPGLGMAILTITILSGVAKAIAAYWDDPELQIRWSNVNRASARSLLGYGSVNLVITITRLSRIQAITLVIGSMMGSATVAIYSFARRLIDYWESAIVSATGVLTPLATAIHSQGHGDRQQVLMVEGGKYTAATSFFFLGFFLSLGRPLILLWIGPKFLFAADLLIILALGEVLPLSQSVTGNILLAMARHRRIAVTMMFELLTIIALGLPLGIQYGLTGFCIVVASTGLVFRGLVILYYGCRIVGVPVIHYLRSALLPAILVASIPALILKGATTLHPVLNFSWFLAYCVFYSVLCAIAYLPLLGIEGVKSLILSAKRLLGGSR